MNIPQPTRKYTAEEKEQLIKNLDIEVEHRVRQLEEWLAVALENFRLHQEGLISRIPKLVRTITMGEFADKYNGDIQACLRGMQSEKIGVNGTEGFEIDRETRKRKWAAAQEEVEASGSGSGSQGQPQEGDHNRAAKNARMMTATPKKATAPPRFPTRTPTVPRAPPTTTTTRPSPSPHKLNKPPSFVPVRSTSPTKPSHHTNTTATTTTQRTRPPSSATFNPTMPPKAPTYPTLRAPRRDESMLSINGSPLANPYTLGLGWFAGEDPLEEDEGNEDEGTGQAGTKGKGKGKGKGKEKQANAPTKTIRRVNSIVIRRDPSVTLGASSSSSSSQPHSSDASSRPNSQAQSQSHAQSHSRTNSRTQLLDPTPAPAPATNPTSTQTQTRTHTPNPLTSHPSASALVSIPTSDGHLLEFDPLTTSPRALDKLVGITDSAKKQAKEEMARLVREAVRKWVIE